MRPQASDPVRVELRCGESGEPIVMDAVDVAIHGLGLQANAAQAQALDAELGIDAEFTLPGQLDRLGLPVLIRQQRQVGEHIHLGLEFAFEDGEQQDWASAALAAFVAERLAEERSLGRVA